MADPGSESTDEDEAPDGVAPCRDPAEPPGPPEPEDVRCPACGGALHANQKDAAGRPLKRVTAEAYYREKVAKVAVKAAGFDAWARANPHRLAEVWPLEFGATLYGPFSGTPAQVAAEDVRRARAMLDEVTELSAAHPECPNVRLPDSPPAVHLIGVSRGSAAAARREFSARERKAANRRAAEALGQDVPNATPVHHITPLDAGGCPISLDNLVSDAELQGSCKRIDDLQTALQGR